MQEIIEMKGYFWSKSLETSAREQTSNRAY